MCTELCQLSYLSAATWGSKKPGEKVAKTIMECPVPIKSALGYYAQMKPDGIKSPYGVEPLKECAPGEALYFNSGEFCFGTVIQHFASGTSALLLQGKVDFYQKNEPGAFCCLFC